MLAKFDYSASNRLVQGKKEKKEEFTLCYTFSMLNTKHRLILFIE